MSKRKIGLNYKVQILLNLVDTNPDNTKKEAESSYIKTILVILLPRILISFSQVEVKDYFI